VGFAKTKVQVSNPANPSKYAELGLLADTGATFALIPGAISQEIGVEAHGKFELRTAGSLMQKHNRECWTYQVPRPKVAFSATECRLLQGAARWG
jgi:hypothetical protein